ncbi:MBG domain-containing protein [Paenibacillus cymbidii]|uniref:MBG domain-containing protein n=1 Tax=Paenibacillus cymbidii TaxID=1639034 RepID=UPI0010805802|nr:MBG domain-containing protein [Paenibacillus cymbidii]
MPNKNPYTSKIPKRVLTLLLALILVCSMAPTPSFAVSNTFTLYFSTADGKLHKDSTSGTVYTDNLYYSSADNNNTLVLGKKTTGEVGNFTFSTSANVALNMPPNTTIKLTDGSANSLASTSTMSSSFGIQGNVLTLAGDTLGTGTLAATSGTATNNASCGVQLYSLAMLGGTLTATGGTASGSNNSSVGMCTSIFNMSGGTLTAIGDTSTSSYGVSGTVTITNGTVTAKGKTRAFLNAPTAAGATITGSSNYAGTSPSTVTDISTSNNSYQYVHIVSDPKTPLTDDMIGSISSQTYTGSQITPAITVTDGSSVLTSGTDYTVAYGENKNAGTDAGSVSITGKGNYTGTVTKNFTISSKNINSTTVTQSSPLTYNGLQQTAAFNVKDGGITLTAGTDYTLANNQQTDAGTSYTATITGTGNFTGTTSGTYEIAKKGLTVTADGFTIAIWDAPPTYTASYDGFVNSESEAVLDGTLIITSTYAKDDPIGTYPITPSGLTSNNYAISFVDGTLEVGKAAQPTLHITGVPGTVAYGDASFTIGTSGGIGDGEVTYAVTSGSDFASITPGANDAAVTITGAGSVTITATKAGDNDYKAAAATASFTVNKRNLSNATVDVTGTFTYTGAAQTPSAVTVTDTATIAAGDWTISGYSNNTNAGTATVTLTAASSGNYTGTANGTFTIAPKSLSGANVTQSETLVYNGSQQAAAFNVEDSGTTLTASADYTLANHQQTDAGTSYTATITGTGNYTGTTSGIFAIDPKDISGATVTQNGTLTYNGLLQSAAFTVTDGAALTANTDYTLSNHQQTNAGESYAATITGTGNYTGTASGTYAIAKAVITITADNKAAITGNAAPSYTYTVTGLAAGETLATVPTLSSMPDMTAVGTYPITASGAVVPPGGNYYDEIVYVDGNLVVSQSPPSDDGSNGTNGSTPSLTPTPKPTPAPIGVPVVVDGKEVNIGTVTVTNNAATITMNQTEFQKQLDNAKTSVVIPVNATENTVTVQLVVKNIEDISKKGMLLTVQVGNISYNIPTEAVDSQAIMTRLGSSDSATAPISITINTLVDSRTETRVATAVASVGGEIVVPAIQFTLTASSGGESYEVNNFSKYVDRSIEVTSEQAEKITTAIVIEPDGTTRHVPTRVYEKDGKWYASINSRTNSVYTLIYNDKSFTDTAGKWYEANANELLSRRIIVDSTDNKFYGDSNITRAQFAAYVVNALGLPSNSGSAPFRDVSASSRYSGAIAAAYEYEIVLGRGDGIFDPDANITRQEAMALIQRAATVASYNGAIGDLNPFADADKLSEWAVESAKFAVGSGLFQGYNGYLHPLDNITKGETASIIIQILRAAGLIN